MDQLYPVVESTEWSKIIGSLDLLRSPKEVFPNLSGILSLK